MTSEQREEAPMIEVSGLHKSYGATPVLNGCDMAIRRGEVAVICGPSGSGKSTLIKCFNGLESFQRGSVRVDGVDVGAAASNLSDLRSRVGMVFQHFELYPHLTVLDNLCLAPMKVLGRTREAAHHKARELLGRVGLPGKIDAYPAQLSGGQQQRIAIARALAMDPIVMLFDEPTSALDPEMIGEVLSVMLELAQDGMTMAVVTHEMGFARRAADNVIFMDAGKVVENTPTDMFFASPRSARAQDFLSGLVSH
ncbi:glutamate/aspartate transport ATP-binding protein GltL 1 [Achromobacter xylosoxidans A8]|uniref:Glutamate/aspartate transport ATP-binding protein GltL 1 n=2 Tax=Alcaligenes xylosoxydans xylosoxydans TaxID=85698 RepID=E3HLS3_ACHXA|nr:glutamate/aspartate transport ATP-binding protein GltL 1 [Achromobacter xylosoxidans A8]